MQNLRANLRLLRASRSASSLENSVQQRKRARGSTGIASDKPLKNRIVHDLRSVACVKESAHIDDHFKMSQLDNLTAVLEWPHTIRHPSRQCLLLESHTLYTHQVIPILRQHTHFIPVHHITQLNCHKILSQGLLSWGLASFKAVKGLLQA